MRLTPVVVLVDDTTLTTLQPTLDALTTHIDGTNLANWGVTNGWTPEMIAWSMLLGKVAETMDFEIVVPGDQ